MWFLMKGGMWTAMTLVALSFISGAPADKDTAANGIEVSEALGAASEAYRYISALCTEKPDVCEKGAETFVALQHRAREGARVAYQIIDRHLSDPAPPAEVATAPVDDTDRLTTGGITVVPVPHARPTR